MITNKAFNWQDIFQSPAAKTVEIRTAQTHLSDGVLRYSSAGKCAALELKRSFAESSGTQQTTLILLLEKAVGSLAIAGNDLERGKDFSLKISVLDKSGKPVKACMPLEVTLSDARGKTLPGTGYYAAENGVLNFKEIAAANLQGSTVKVTVKCLASGKTVSKVLNIK